MKKGTNKANERLKYIRMSKKSSRHSSSTTINMSRPKVDLSNCPDYTWVFEMFNKFEKQYHSFIGSVNQEYLKEITTKLQEDLVKSNRKKVQIGATMKEEMKNTSTQFIGLMNKLNESNYNSVISEFENVKITNKKDLDNIIKLFVECIETEKSKLVTVYIRLLYDLAVTYKWVFDTSNIFTIICNQLQFHYKSVMASILEAKTHNSEVSRNEIELLCQIAKIVHLMHHQKMLSSEVFKCVFDELSNNRLFEPLIALINENYSDSNVAYFEHVLSANLYDTPRIKRIIMNWLDNKPQNSPDTSLTHSTDEVNDPFEYEERIFHLMDTYYKTTASVADLFSSITNQELTLLNVLKYHIRETIPDKGKYIKLMKELDNLKKIKLSQLMKTLDDMEQNKEDYMFDYPFFDTMTEQLRMIKI
jgi:hypothetical protein